MTKYLNIIKCIHGKYAGIHKHWSYLSSLDQKRLWLTEFRQIFIDTGIVNDYFSERDIILAFNLSCSIVKNEDEDDKCQSLNVFEFVEALSRAAEKIALLPVGIIISGNVFLINNIF